FRPIRRLTMGTQEKPRTRRISGERLVILLAVTWLTGACSIGFLLYRFVAVFNTYELLFAQEVRQVELSPETQVACQKEVQEWQGVPLGGSQESDRRYSTAKFLAMEAQTASLAELLQTQSDGETRESVTRFIALHRELAANYRRALSLFEKGGY